jgi:hypothetical protein
VDEDFLREISDEYGMIDFSSADDLRRGLDQLLSLSTAGANAGGLEPAAAGGLSETSQWT